MMIIDKVTAAVFYNTPVNFSQGEDKPLTRSEEGSGRKPNLPKCKNPPGSDDGIAPRADDKKADLKKTESSAYEDDEVFSVKAGGYVPKSWFNRDSGYVDSSRPQAPASKIASDPERVR